jgi:multidrug resistance efflux pump
VDPASWMYASPMVENAPAEVRELCARAAAGGGRPARAAAGGDKAVAELSRLSELWKTGALSDSEFADAKARLLPQIGR